VVKGVFISYRGGKRTQRNKQVLIKTDGVTDRNEAARFIGRKVLWNNPKGEPIIGKIVGIHGRRGVLKASFRKGLPGQALGTMLTIC